MKWKKIEKIMREKNEKMKTSGKRIRNKKKLQNSIKVVSKFSEENLTKGWKLYQEFTKFKFF